MANEAMGVGALFWNACRWDTKKELYLKEKQVSYVSNGRSLLQKTQNVEKIRCFTFTLSFFPPSSFFYISIVVVRYLKNLFLTSIMFCYYKARYFRNEEFKVKVCFFRENIFVEYNINVFTKEMKGSGVKHGNWHVLFFSDFHVKLLKCILTIFSKYEAHFLLNTRWSNTDFPGYRIWIKAIFFLFLNWKL